MKSEQAKYSGDDTSRLLALELFREDKVSLGRAAELCEKPIEAFMEFIPPPTAGGHEPVRSAT